MSNFSKAILLSVAIVILLTVVPASAQKYTLHLGEEITLSGYKVIYGGYVKGGCVLLREDKQGGYVALNFNRWEDMAFYIGSDRYIRTDNSREEFFFQDENEPDESWFGWFE